MIAGGTESLGLVTDVLAARPIGLAHLTLLAVSPPELIEIAAAAGYDFVGIRVRAVTDAEREFPMHPGTPMLADTVARLQDTRVEVRDIEFLPLTATTTAADWLPALEAGAALGARVFTVAGADDDRARLHDTLAALTVAAADFGIRPALEPISYQSVSTVADATELASSTGAAILLDSLHLQRGGSTLMDVAGLPSDLVPVVQLCDVPLLAPHDDGDRVATLQREARQERLPVGRGELALVDLISVCPPAVPVSLEIPNASLQRTMSALAWAQLNLEAMRALLTETETPAAYSALGTEERRSE